MKLNYIATAALSLCLLAGCADSKAKLNAEAKITESQARQTALARVPNGRIKESELERENGHLQWSFDVATPDTKDITEVNVDAISGEVLGVSKEKAESEDAEKKEKEN
ncbi:MAG TPA: PepSY domain-containing protein [Verrucomicrobiae bacterium]